MSTSAKCAAGALLLLIVPTIIPLPFGVISALSSETARLGEEFSIRDNGWLTLSLSPAGTVQRLWQLGMIGACFLLARAAGRERRFVSLFCHALACAMLLEAAAELWRLADGEGIWSSVRNYPAGTFANRNHYANWMALGTMICLGAFIRKWRGAKPLDAGAVARIALFGGAVLTGIATIILCGSRGGVLALGTGLGVWAALLARRKAAAGVIAIFGACAAAAAGVFALGGGLLMERVANPEHLEFKTALWKGTLALWREFPVFGAGLGAFEPAFNHFKSFHGSGTFLFAENEYAQVLAETGLAGFAAFAVLAVLGLRRLWASRGGGHRNYIECGLIAALGAFAVHAFFEFVFHVPANALLAAAAAGLLFGLADRGGAPVVERPPGRASILTVLGLAVFLCGLGGIQALALGQWNSALAQTGSAGRYKMEQAVRAWPLDSERAIARARAEIAAGSAEGYAKARAALDAALKWNPYDWELRLESAWLELAFSPDRPSALREAEGVRRLNPLQAKIPLRFAKTLAPADPRAAIEFLFRAPLRTEEEVRRGLEILWEIERNPARLWELTPATGEGFAALAEFARRKKLEGMAAEARARGGAAPQP